MPNWCENNMKVTGDGKDLTEIRDALLNKDDEVGFLDFCKPEPKFEGENDWYEWRNRNWGTKWEIARTDSKDATWCTFVSEVKREGDGRVTFTASFGTAWSPPTQALESLVERYPDIHIELQFHEPGMGFVGRWDSDWGEGVVDSEENPELYEKIAKREFGWESEIDG